MVGPGAPIYPYDSLDSTTAESLANGAGIMNTPGNNSNTQSAPAVPSQGTSTYPDYNPWLDHTQIPGDQAAAENSKIINTAYLNKGYFEPPLVSNEYYSARNMIQNTIFLSPAACQLVLLDLLSLLADAYRVRNDDVNRIRHDLNTFRLPPRVTLTSLKRDAWMKDLANPDIPLLLLLGRIPHGVRNRVLVDGLVAKQVPLPRALWFTKCVLYSELGKRHMHHQQLLTASSSQLGATGSTDPLLQDWTHQLVDYVYKFSREVASITSPERKQMYMSKLRYLLSYVQALYIECLVDKAFFLTLVGKFFHVDALVKRTNEDDEIEDNNEDSDAMDAESTSSLSLGQKLIALTLVKTYWTDLLKHDHICKELAESLLLNHFLIMKSMKRKRSGSSGAQVFHGSQGSPDATNANLFTPSTNASRGTYDPEFGPPTVALPLLKSIAELILHLFKHNSSLFIIPNYWPVVSKSLSNIIMTSSEDNSPEKPLLKKQFRLIKYRNESLMLSSSDGSMPSIRSQDDLLSVVHQFETLKLNMHLAEKFAESGPRGTILVKIVLHYCVSPSNSTESILVLCNFLKSLVVPKISPTHRAEFDSEVLEVIYTLAEDHLENPRVDSHRLYVLINELYQLKILTISLYLRKLIASGVFYQSGMGSTLVSAHLEVLKNLPVLNNKQCDSILKKWTERGGDFQKQFDQGKQIVEEEILTMFTKDYDPSKPSAMDLKNLSVGLKFLLINWTTTQIKSLIINSPKLVHITPVILANLYNFYLLCASLTVFFKVILRFILKNDGMIIIYYLDTLRLIARLVMKHEKLVNLVQPQPQPLAKSEIRSSLFGAELNSPSGPPFGAGSPFALASPAPNSLQSMSSISTPTIYSLIINSYIDLSTRDADYFSFHQVWKFIDQIYESSGPNCSDTNHIDEFSTPYPPSSGISTVIPPPPPPTIRSQLDMLLQSRRLALSPSEMEELAAQFPIDNGQDPLELLTLVSESQEPLLMRLLVSQSDSDLSNFTHRVKNTIAKLDSTSLIITILVKLVVNDVIEYSVALEWFPHLATLGTDHLAVDQKLSLSVIEDRYYFKSPRVLLTLYNKISPAILEQVSIRHREMMLNEFLDPEKSIDDFLDYLKVVGLKLDANPSDETFWYQVASITDEFSLPFVQVLLRIVQSKTNGSTLAQMVETFIKNIRLQFDPLNLYFGELFEFLEWDHRLQVLGWLEDGFLKKNLGSDGDNEEVGFLLEFPDSGPPLKDFFKKFLVTASVPTTPSFFELLTKYVTILCDEINLDLPSNEVYTSLCITLRILIIHKENLGPIIAETPSFYSLLAQILNSKYLSSAGHEKVRILLYDLLSLILSSSAPPRSPEKSGTAEDSTSSLPQKSCLETITATISPPDRSNPLAQYVTPMPFSLALDQDELSNDGDFHFVNGDSLVVIDKREHTQKLTFKSFEILEDTGDDINGGFINLLLFEAYTTKQNPP